MLTKLASFFKKLPTKTLALKSEKCSGGKLAKDRITYLFACSAMGEKLRPFVIGKSLRPRAFREAHVNEHNLLLHAVQI